MRFLILLLVAGAAEARPWRVEQVPFGGEFWCTLCHRDFGGDERNDFGSQVEATLLIGGNVNWPAIFADDADGDGYTNGEELGDPHGLWRPGDPDPAVPKASHPAHPEDVPCGNGRVEAAEVCDLEPPPGESCEARGFLGGEIRCGEGCELDLGECHHCGDGLIAENEDCEAGQLGDATCRSLGYLGGRLSCGDRCRYDASECEACGNARLDEGEACDGALIGSTCEAYGFGGGALSCTPECAPDTSQCTRCGDGEQTAPEACDGADLGGETCATRGFGRGPLRCTAACTFDVSGCLTCGDGALAPSEACDGPALGGASCESLGFDVGVLRCTLDRSDCTRCGDGVRAGAEACDRLDLGEQSCGRLGFDGGALRCAPDCELDAAACHACGDGLIGGPERCDGENLGELTCAHLGFAGGALACEACRFDLSRCHHCGDNLIHEGEACDGIELGGRSCVTEGFDGGRLGCEGCQLDTGGCTICGDGLIEGGEACEGEELGGRSCADAGFLVGELGCNPDCTLDTSGCGGDPGPVCGDGVRGLFEACDGADLHGATCQSLGFDSGTLACAQDCSFVTWDCARCGDGLVGGEERCETDLLLGRSCVTEGFDGGSLACGPDCNFVTRGCTICGDGVREGAEACEGEDLGGAGCERLGFVGGSLACGPGCAFDTSGCHRCGDGRRDPEEACDGADLAGGACADFGFVGGELACGPECVVDTRGCHDCGDGRIGLGESCDGAELGGLRCADVGFTVGPLACDAQCRLDTQACEGPPRPTCGDGVRAAPEQCDGADLGGASCESLGFVGGTLACGPRCGFDDRGCTLCGDHQLDAEEACDGPSLGGRTCLTEGFASGRLVCARDCTLNTSGCHAPRDAGPPDAGPPDARTPDAQTPDAGTPEVDARVDAADASVAAVDASVSALDAAPTRGGGDEGCRAAPGADSGWPALLLLPLLVLVFRRPSTLALVAIALLPGAGHTAPLTGTVVDDAGQPLEGARVRATAVAPNNFPVWNEEHALTDAEGRFALELPDIEDADIRLGVGKPGYENVAGLVSLSPDGALGELRLPSLDEVDNPGYVWEPPYWPPEDPSGQGCSSCHEKQYEAWQGSKMAGSARNPRVLGLYTGTDRWGRPAGEGYRLDHPDRPGPCANCHAPAAAIDGEVRLDEVEGIAREGVFCDICHKVREVEVGAGPGVGGALQIQRPTAAGLFAFGPFEDVTGPMRTSYSELISTSRMCAGCHEWRNELGAPVMTTWSEWSEVSGADPEALQCQDCHMKKRFGPEYRGEPESRALIVSDEEVGRLHGVLRPTSTVYPHTFQGAAELIGEAAELELEARQAGDEILVTVTVANANAGHALPTGMPFRHLVLVVAAQAGGEALRQTEGPTVPDYGGELAGQAGRGYARVLGDGTGARNVPFWRATEVLEDTRIRALEQDRVQLRFARPEAGEVVVAARLLYRRYFPEMVAAKGWSEPEVLMARTGARLRVEDEAAPPVVVPDASVADAAADAGAEDSAAEGCGCASAGDPSAALLLLLLFGRRRRS